jgi:anaerobic selenocysteine-containing dehydrogenase
MVILAKAARAVADMPHGADLGALKPSLLARLETADGRIQCAPEVMLADLRRVRADLVERRQEGIRLVGRRHLRSNNSWMHNAHRLTKGPRRDQLWMSPADAAALGLREGDAVNVRSGSGSVSPTVHVTDRVTAGVVCLPHGFGQAREGVRLSVAKRVPGVSYNDLAEESAADAVSGNAAVNALPVTLEPIA